MKNQNTNIFKQYINKLYGKLNMNWLVVLLLAIGTAILTTIFLTVPLFRYTSFYRMGETFEAWIFFAIIIMANCKTPLESATKTFAFFLISQPLIYLFQVPFSWQGWELFKYYDYWFFLTLLTFPMAFVGWYITKKNWFSVLILSPILILLSIDVHTGINGVLINFPHFLVLLIFCLMQILTYIYVFFPSMWKKIFGLTISIITIVIISLITSRTPLFTSSIILPNNATFSSTAEITVENSSIAEATFGNYKRTSTNTILITAHKYGKTVLTITDQGEKYLYTLEIYNDDHYFPQILITPKEH